MLIKLASLLILMNTACARIEPQDPITPNPEPQPPPPEEVYRMGVVLVGDTGTGEPDQYKVAEGIRAFCAKIRCDLGLLLGDNIYPNGIKTKTDPQMQSKFEKPYEDLTFQFFPVIGNHDDRGSWKAQVEYESPRWRMFGRWYSMENHFVSFYALDTNFSAFQNPLWPQQRDWIKQELAENASRWTIVYGHHPVYSEGEHGDTLFLKHYLKPLLEEHEVDFYVAGHDHDKQLIERDGVAYVVSGAGAKLRATKVGEHTKFAKASLGFAHLLLGDTKAVLRFMDRFGNVEYEKVYAK